MTFPNSASNRGNSPDSHRQARHLHRVCGVRAPPQRTRHVHMDIPSPANTDRLRDFSFQVMEIGQRPSRHRGSHARGQSVARSSRSQSGCRMLTHGFASCWFGRTEGSPPSVGCRCSRRLRCRNRDTGRHRFAQTSRTDNRTQCRPSLRHPLRDHRHVVTPLAAPRRSCSPPPVHCRTANASREFAKRFRDRGWKRPPDSRLHSRQSIDCGWHAWRHRARNAPPGRFAATFGRLGDRS